jgi:hypothetical protein
MQITGNSDQRQEHMLDKVLTPIGDLKRLVIQQDQHTEKYFTLDASSAGKDSFEDHGGTIHQESTMVSDAMVSNPFYLLTNPKLQKTLSHDHEHLPPPAKKRSLPSTQGKLHHSWQFPN